MARTAHVQLCHAPGQGGDKLRLRTWIEVQLVGEDDKPIPNEQYEIRLPGGALRQGTLDENGIARIDDIPPGTCQVSFPKLDRDAWIPIDASTETETASASNGQAA